MKLGKVVLPCVAAALLAAGCTVRPALPFAAVHVPPPVVVEAPPPPVVIAPVAYGRKHPGRGHRKHHHH